MARKLSQRIHHLPLARKIVLVATLLLVPTLLIGTLLVWAQGRQIAAVQNELDGIRHARPYIDAMAQAAGHRNAAALALAGIANRDQAKAIEADLESSLRAIDTVNGEFGAHFGTEGMAEEIHRAWERVVANWASATPAASSDMHDQVTNRMAEVIRATGVASKLAVGSGRLSLADLPGAIEDLGRLAAFGAAAAARPNLSGTEWDELAVLLYNARRSTETVRLALLGAGGKRRPEPRIQAVAEAAVVAAETFLESVQDASRRPNFNVDVRTHLEKARAASTAMTELQTALLAETESSLSARVSSLSRDRVAQLATTALLMLAALAVGLALASMVGRQVKAMNRVFGRIRGGDLTARVEVLGRDELGQFAESLNLVLDNSVALVQSREERDRIQSSIRKLLAEMDGVAAGDLTQEAAVTPEITGAIAESFNHMLAQLRELIRRVKNSTQMVNAAASGVRDVTQELASGSESQAIQIVQASSGIERVTAAIQQITQQAAAAAEISKAASRSAQHGGQFARKSIDGIGEVRRQMAATSALVRDLSVTSAQVGEVAQLIGDISKRTGILALNASIQAALAGDAGAGFAVVAEEVEQLASRSAEGAKRVSSLVASLQTATTNAISAINETARQAATGTELATQASQRLAEIESVSARLGGVIDSILQACRQQSTASESINHSMIEISKVIRRTAGGAQEAATSIRDLTNLVDELNGSVARFRLPASETAVAVARR